MKVLFLIFMVLTITLIVIKQVSGVIKDIRMSGFKSAFMGDWRSINPSSINSISRVNSLQGDPISGDYSQMEDDDYEDDDLIGDAGFGNKTDSSDFVSGDIDKEWDNSRLTEGDFIEGGFFNRAASRKKASGKSVNPANYAKAATTLLKRTQQKKATFPQNLLLEKDQRKILDSNASVESKQAALATTQAISQVPGALAATKEFARIAVVGGEIKIAETLLKIPGQQLIDAIRLYESQYPGLSRSTSQITPASGILAFPFPAPTGKEVTKVLAVFVKVTSPELKKITGAEISISLGGKINTVAATWTRDKIALFTGNAVETSIMMIPTVEVRASLYAIPFDVPAADPNDIQIDFTGLPEGSNVVVRLCGIDSSEFSEYKAMLGLR